MGIDLHWSISTALACCIWLIYTLDHLIDANRTVQRPSMNRHQFHQKYSRPITILFVLIACLGLRVLFYLPQITLIYGCMMLGAVGFYFLSIWFFRIYFAKEIFIAALYSCGVFIGIFSNSEAIQILTFFYFFQTILLAFINLLIFSYFEEGSDKRDGHQSWATHYGADKTMKHLKLLFWVLGLLILTSLFYLQTLEEFMFQLILIAMTSVLVTITAKPDRFIENERFRWLGDMIFVLPALIFLF